MMRVLLMFAAVSAFAVAAVAAETERTGAGYHAVTLPTEAGAGDPKEIKVVLDTPHVKLATITLRAGTVLEEHSAPMPVTIQSLAGTGTVKMGDKTETIGPGRMVFLAPNVAHEVVPEGKSDLVLLVHHIKPTPAGTGPGRGRK